MEIENGTATIINFPTSNGKKWKKRAIKMSIYGSRFDMKVAIDHRIKIGFKSSVMICFQEGNSHLPFC